MHYPKFVRRLGDVYANAAITIAASVAQDSETGILRARHCSKFRLTRTPPPGTHCSSILKTRGLGDRAMKSSPSNSSMLSTRTLSWSYEAGRSKNASYHGECFTTAQSSSAGHAMRISMLPTIQMLISKRRFTCRGRLRRLWPQ